MRSVIYIGLFMPCVLWMAALWAVSIFPLFWFFGWIDRRPAPMLEAWEGTCGGLVAMFWNERP